MMDKAELKSKLRPFVQKAGPDAKLFSDLAFPVALEYFHSDSEMKFDQMADTWNWCVIELLEELKVSLLN